MTAADTGAAPDGAARSEGGAEDGAARTDGRAEDERTADGRWRLFLAIEVAPDAAATIDAGLAPLRRRHKAKWTSTDAFHLTLAFLGSIDPAAAPAIGDLARTVAARTAPFAIATTTGGGVRRLRDGTAWLGIGEGATTIRALADELATGVAAILGPDGPAPRRAPAPHLTVARRASQALIDDLASEAGGPIHVGWTAERIVLLRSHLDPDRARYVLVDAAPLRGAPARG